MPFIYSHWCSTIWKRVCDELHRTWLPPCHLRNEDVVVKSDKHESKAVSTMYKNFCFLPYPLSHSWIGRMNIKLVTLVMHHLHCHLGCQIEFRRLHLQTLAQKCLSGRMIPYQRTNNAFSWLWCGTNIIIFDKRCPQQSMRLREIVLYFSCVCAFVSRNE